MKSVLPSPTAEAKGNSRKQNMGPEEEWKSQKLPIPRKGKVQY